MNELMNNIMTAVLPTVVNFVTLIIFGIIVSAFKRWVKNNEVRGLVADVVKFVEQTYKGGHGDEKLAAAELHIEKLLASKGIKTYMSSDELRTLIESTVFEMNASLKSETDSSNNDETGGDD